MTQFFKSGLVLALSSLLGACVTAPPADDTLKSAAELAVQQLPGGAGAKPLFPVIGELPQPPAAPTPAAVNRLGDLPAIRSTDSTAPPTPAVDPKDDTVSLDMEQVELRQILEMITDTLNMTVVIDPSIGDKVTIRTAPDKPLRHKDLWPLLQMLLSENAIVMEQKGGVYHLKKEKAALPATIGGPGSQLARSHAAQVLQVTPLRYINVEAALTTLKPLVEPEGRLLSISALNILGIVTSPDKLGRINNILNLVDADPFVYRGIRLFRLSNSKATEMKGELDKILLAVEGKSPSYETIALERVNALLVVAPPKRGFEEVARWVSILDEPNEAGGEQVFIYRVRNLKATTLASTLSDVFKLEDKDNKVKRPDEKNAKDDPKTPEPAATPENPATPPVETPPSPTAAAQATAAVSAQLKVTIVADEDTNTLLVRSTPKDYRQLLSTIALLDTLPKEVMINVVVAEVELTNQQQFGIDWYSLFGPSDKSVVGTNFNVPGTSGVASDGTVTFGDHGLVVGYVSKSISAILNALSSDGRVELLSRPSLLVRNNQEASINVGSDEPTITQINQTATSTLNTGYTSNQVQYRKTGIILTVKPQINEDGVVNMDVKQEVSALGPPGTTQQLPSFRQRTIETSLVVSDGAAVVMGGLIQTGWDNSYEGVPYLQDVPVLGQLFKGQKEKRTRTELVVIIVPQIVHPDADNRAYVTQFRDRMGQVKRLMEEDVTPIYLPMPTSSNSAASETIAPALAAPATTGVR